MKQTTKTATMLGMVLIVLFLTGCVDNTGGGYGGSGSYSTQDQKPQVCSQYQMANFQRILASNVTRTTTTTTTSNQSTTSSSSSVPYKIWNGTNWVAADYKAAEILPTVTSTGLNVQTHVLVYKGKTGVLFRNQSFSIVIDPVDSGSTVSVNTIDAKASTNLFHSFGSLNEVEIRVTPIVNSSYLPETYVVRKFIPCTTEPWFINIPYELKKNTTTPLSELKVPDLILRDKYDEAIITSNPVEIGINDIVDLDMSLTAGPANRKITIEYDPAQIVRIQILDPEDNDVKRTTMPINESIFRAGDVEVAYGPLSKAGTYRVLFYSTSVQPTNTAQAKLYEGDKLIRATEIRFANKSFRADIAQDTNLRYGIVVALIILAMILGKYSGGKR